MEFIGCWSEYSAHSLTGGMNTGRVELGKLNTVYYIGCVLILSFSFILEYTLSCLAKESFLVGVNYPVLIQSAQFEIEYFFLSNTLQLCVGREL